MSVTLEKIVTSHIQQIHSEVEIEENVYNNKITKTDDPITETNVCITTWCMFALLLHLRNTPPAIAINLVREIQQGGIEFYQDYVNRKITGKSESMIKEQNTEKIKTKCNAEIGVYDMDSSVYAFDLLMPSNTTTLQ